MNYFTRIGDRLVFRLIRYGILLHATICIAALGAIVGAPFVVWDLVTDVRLAEQMKEEAQIITVPLVNREEERFDARSGMFLCYVELPDSVIKHGDDSVRLAIPHLRPQAATGLDSLRIFSHPPLDVTPSKSRFLSTSPISNPLIRERPMLMRPV